MKVAHSTHANPARAMAGPTINDICSASRLAVRLCGRHAALTDLRRALHACPELGYNELQTASIIVEQLRGAGVDEIHQGIARTGIVGVVCGEGRDGPSD